MDLKVEKHIEIKGKRARLVSRAIADVIKQFSMRARVKGLKKLRIYVTKNPIEVCKKIIMSGVKLRRHGEMREWICQNAPSFSYWEEGAPPTIMIDAHEEVIKTGNYAAIKGLFAHELMHLLNKLDGLEDELEGEAERAAKNMFNFLLKHKEVKPFTRERLLGSFIRITTSTLLFIKDIFANTRAMSFGFDDELYENYKITLANVKKEIRFTEEYVLTNLKKGEKHVLDDVFVTYLGLNISWVTFKMFHNIWFKELQRMARIEVPRIIKRECDPILNEILKLRSASDKRQIAKILRLTQQNYFNVVKHYCKKLR
jgi:hypothetical protein